MSVPPKEVLAYNNTHLDWKQLGMVAAYVASYPKCISREGYHCVKFCFGPVEEEAFMENLLLTIIQPDPVRGVYAISKGPEWVGEGMGEYPSFSLTLNLVPRPI